MRLLRKTVSGIMLFLLLVSTLTLAFNIQPVRAEPETIIVPDKYLTIQAAVNAASPGDTIIVRDGTYTENVDVNKDHLTIKSENGAEKTIVQAANPDDHVFEVTASYVSISGFTVKGATKISLGWLVGQICLYQADNCTVSNCVILDIRDPATETYNAGIFLRDSDDNLLLNNIIDGINANFGAIGIYTSHNNIVAYNTLSHVSSGIELVSSNNNAIMGNILSYISGPNINIGGVGITLHFDSTNNIIEDNKISNATCTGISLGKGGSETSNTVVGNTVSNSSEGIRVMGGYGSDNIYLNNFVDNTLSCYLHYSWLYTTNNWRSPEQITYTYNGSTFTNYLGNYWSDYSGNDPDGDGIGNTPYTFYAVSQPWELPGIIDQDNYPLMEPFENYGIGPVPEDTTPPISVTDLWTLDITNTGFVYPTGKAGPYTYAGWLAGDPEMPPYQEGYYHLGQDMEANEGDDVYAIADGEIIYVSVSGWGEGNFGLLVKHKLNTGEEFLALYGHVRPNSEDLRYTVSGPVDPPVPVIAGEAFATIGPYDSIPHLHFGIRPGSEIPPSPWGRMPLDNWHDTNGFVDPINWINTHIPYSPIDPVSSIVLTWTAPGDDGNVGTASEYHITYFTSLINDANWDLAIQCSGEPAPQLAGSTETFVVTGLSAGITYYFALKTADEVPNWSGLSNVASGTTETLIAKPVITTPLKITPMKDTYYMGDTLTAKFTITNWGVESITFDTLVVGGRDPYGEVVDFEKLYDITLNPGDSYDYQGSLILPDKPGIYHFFCAYHTVEHIPGEDEYNWNTNIDVVVNGGITEDFDVARVCRESDILVLEEIYISSALGPASWEEVRGPWESWPKDKLGRSWNEISAIAVNPNNPKEIYVAAIHHTENWWENRGGMLFKSTDSGESWIPINEGLPRLSGWIWDKSTYYWPISAIAIAPSNPNIIYIGTSCLDPYNAWAPGGVGIYKSIDGGSTWFECNGKVTWEFIAEFPKYDVSSMVVDPTNPDVVYVGTIGGGIWRTIDGGETWWQIWSPIGELCFDVNALAISPADPSIIYAAIYNYVPYSGWGIPTGLVFQGGLYRLEDGGLTSEKIFGNRVDDIVVDNGNSNVLYIVTCGYEVYKSINGDEEWVDISGTGGADPLPHVYFDNPWNKPAYSLAMNPDFTNWIFAASKLDCQAHGVRFSPNSGENWFPIGLQNEMVTEIILASDLEHHILYAVTTYSKEHETYLFKYDFSNSAIVVQRYSPVELRVYDSEGRVTGLMNGEAKAEIPKSVYCDGTITIFSPADSYYYEVTGTDEGTYGLVVLSVEDGEVFTFTATDIPIAYGAMHEYTINWTALSLGEEGVTLQIDSDGDGTFEQSINADNELTHDEFMLQTATIIDFNPDTLNLKSKGEFVTVYIEFPEGYDVADINVSTILLNGTIPVDADAPVTVGDYDNDGIPDLMVKFERSEVTAYIIANVNMTELYEKRFMTITLTVTGYLNNGTPFQASTTIKIVYV